MWKFKQFAGKEPTGLEGKTIDIGNVKIQIQNVIAEGGFSTVYLARDATNMSKHYALKHLICQDGESLALAMKEISVMKLLKGHPNVVTLVAHTTLDMGRRKEALLVMEFCEKSLVNVLENKGSEFVEKQILLIFRDVCNAVFAMHSQTPPIAHRDLKAENVLLGSDGSWKLCDFGSTSSNHKCFDKPEEMGIEEDNIRKHTTPAYRAPEMWDLYRKDFISEKVDIWALGCLLFKLCYSKLAFDGESKLQILNGNYRIPNTPKYSGPLTKLIKDMLENSPDDRPDITQVWFRVNELLPLESQKDLPDGSISASAIDNHSPSSTVHGEGTQKRSPAMPRRNPPPPPPKEQNHGTSTLTNNNKGGSPMGAFWSTQHAQNAQVIEDKKNIHKNVDFEISFSAEEKPKPQYGNEAFNTFVADFDAANNINSVSKSRKEEELEAEVASLKEKLKQANLEKDEITLKFEKLSAICRSQRQELQELKRNIPSSTPSAASKDNSKTPETPKQREKIEGTVWELQQGMFQNSSSPSDTESWNAFAEVPKQQTPVQASSPAQTPKATNPKSVRTAANGHRSSLKSQTPSPSTATDGWGFGHDSFKAAAAASGTSIASPETLKISSSKNGGEAKKAESNQPAGWAGF